MNERGHTCQVGETLGERNGAGRLQILLETGARRTYNVCVSWQHP